CVRIDFDGHPPLRDPPALVWLHRPRLGGLRPLALGHGAARRAGGPLTTGESKGDPAILNPEQLVVMAASSCQMLWFLHLAAKARLDVVEYEDDATALMPMDEEPVRITEIALHPRVTVAGQASEERVRKLMRTAHEHCFIANSLNSRMTLEPTVELRA
ncbi:MAG: OsmC family protein, partial [Thermoleophilaceae bacterium]